MPDPKPYDHFRATLEATVEPGVYRVVGVDDPDVTLLQVADGDGRRVNSGRVVSVPTGDLAREFEAVDESAVPEGGGGALRGSLGVLRWLVAARADVAGDHPVASVVALAAVVVGYGGPFLDPGLPGYVEWVGVAGLLYFVLLPELVRRL